jgi:proteasome lid subunit RPN8/RPN11
VVTPTRPQPAIDLGALVVEPPRVGMPARGQRRFVGQTIACELQAAAARRVRDHAVATPKLEVGGLLVGDVYDLAGGGFHVDVSAALPARRAISGSLHLRFGLAAWLDLTRQRRAQHGRVVGWYHSHPGIGVFLSAVDRNLHSCFFDGLPWYVALVFDPASGELGAFACDGGALVQLSQEEST